MTRARTGGTMFLVMGEALVDVISGGEGEPSVHVGGAPLNVAVGMARLEMPVTFVARYGRDEYGQMIHERLQDNGVVELLTADALPTAQAHARLDPAGGADYEFHPFDWDLSAFTGVEAERAIEDAVAVHIGSIGAVMAPGAQTVKETVVRAHPHATISYDPNVRPTVTPDREAVRAQVEDLIGYSDVVRASDDDLEWLYPGQEPLESARAWLQRGPALVVVTRGADGAYGLTANAEAHAKAIPARVEDTVGAGDSSMSAILAALDARDLLGGAKREALAAMDERTLHEILTYAVRAAAITVSRTGANPPTKAELES